MGPMDWTVLLGGIGLVAWINWYFFLAHPRVGRGTPSGGVQEATIIVEGGYEPAEVRIAAGLAVRLTFDRRERSGCSEEIVFPGLSIRRFLPPFEKTSIDLKPLAPGTYEFTCGMSMLHGRVLAEPTGSEP